MAALACFALLGATAACGAETPSATSSASKTADATATVSPSTSAGGGESAQSSAQDSDSKYQDGSYTATANYTSPGGTEQIQVDLTLSDDVVTAVTVTPQSPNPTGQQFETQFASGIAAEVVGKSIDEISVSRVSGSSLTGGGFNKAIESIKADALN